MCSLVGVAGSYSKVELHTWYLWIAVDHTYNRIHVTGLMGSHELLCTFFYAFIISTFDISVFKVYWRFQIEAADILTESWSIENALEKKSCTLEIDFSGT